MTVNEQLVENIVKEVMAKVALTSDDEKQLGIFTDMNEAIAAAKQAQAVVRRMSMDQREKIISNIRTKIKENAEVMARMGVEETGMGNVGHKILNMCWLPKKHPAPRI